MDEQGYRFGVGVLVVASLVIAIILILFFGAAPNLFARRYTVTIRFDAAPGVTTDTPVRKNGVQIGRVRSVELLDTDGVDLTLELDSQYKVRAGELPRIGTGSLITGDAAVEFIPPTEESLIERFDGLGGSQQDGMLDSVENALASAEIKDGDFFRGGRVAPDPLDALINMQDSMSTTLGAIETAGNQVTALAQDVRRVIGGSDGEFQRIAQQAEETIVNFNRTLNSIESVFSDPNLRNSIATINQRLPELVQEAELVMSQVGTTVEAFERTAVSFERVGVTAESTIRDVSDAVSGISETIDNVTEFTEPLAEQGDVIVSQAIQTMENLDRLLVDLRGTSAQVNQVVTRINRGQGTFAKLVDDPQLYYSLINTLQNVETLTRRLHPIVEDARVFSDKVARNPSALIQGAISGRPGGIK